MQSAKKVDKQRNSFRLCLALDMPFLFGKKKNRVGPAADHEKVIHCEPSLEDPETGNQENY